MAALVDKTEEKEIITLWTGDILQGFYCLKKEKSGCRPKQRSEVGSMEEMYKVFV